MAKKRKTAEEYWAERFIELQESQLKNAEQVASDMDKAYRQAINTVERDINTWYARFAANNEIDLAEAQKLLTAGQLEEFKWTVEDYIKYGRKNALDQAYMKQLENASARVHVRRLDAIKLQLQHQVEALHAKRYQDLETLSTDLYTERYYRAMYNTQLGFNLGWNIDKLNRDAINTIIRKPWAPDGLDFSKRIWRDRSRMVNILHNDLTQSIILGQGPKQVIDKMANTFNVSKNTAGRLVMTESAFFASAGQKQAFADLDVEKYKYVATLDLKTSDICQEMDGQVFEINAYQVGVTAPPLHAWCRSTTAPFFEDNYGERIARGEDGKTYYVPNDMKYEDWKSVFVDKQVTMDRWQNKLDPLSAKFKGVYDKWDKTNVKKFATDLLKSENINLPVNRRKINANGQCQLQFKSDVIEVLTYELNSADIRDMDYQVKTAFHELFHAKSDGLDHGGVRRKYRFDDWAYYDDVFAESFAHHMSKSVGIQREIMPAYPGHLIETLPKLKTLDDFKDCNTIADFGAVAQKYRFSKDATTDWSDLKQLMGGVKFDKISYSKQYLDYIEDNVEDLVDKALENMPQYKSYRSNMISDVKDGIFSVRNGYRLSGNSEMMFDQTLLLSMNRLGVK